MQPSESTRSKVVRVAPWRAVRRPPASTWASVVSTTSIVARAGASMPAPLAMPPTVHVPSGVSTETCAVLATVSVVMIAVAAARPPSVDNAAAAVSTPASSASIGTGWPITPVDATTTSPEEMPSTSPTFSAVSCTCTKPSGPVQTFAEPELSTTAETTPSLTTCRDHTTGCPTTRLVVNTPAPTCAGPSFTTRARSGRPEGLSPATTPDARNPAGAVTPGDVPGLVPTRASARWSVTVPLRPEGGRGPRAGRGPGSMTAAHRRRCP